MDIGNETDFRVAYTDVIQAFARDKGVGFEKASEITYFGYKCCASSDHFESEMILQGYSVRNPSEMKSRTAERYIEFLSKLECLMTEYGIELDVEDEVIDIDMEGGVDHYYLSMTFSDNITPKCIRSMIDKIRKENP